MTNCRGGSYQKRVSSLEQFLENCFHYPQNILLPWAPSPQGWKDDGQKQVQLRINLARACIEIVFETLCGWRSMCCRFHFSTECLLATCCALPVSRQVCVLSETLLLLLVYSNRARFLMIVRCPDAILEQYYLNECNFWCYRCCVCICRTE